MIDHFRIEHHSYDYCEEKEENVAVQSGRTERRGEERSLRSNDRPLNTIDERMVSIIIAYPSAAVFVATFDAQRTDSPVSSPERATAVFVLRDR